MVLLQYPITGKTLAADSTTGFPDASVTLRNTTTKQSRQYTAESDGSFAFDLQNFTGGYSNGDALKLEGRLGSFYQTASLTVDTSVPGINQDLTMGAESTIDIIDMYRLKEEIIVFLRQRIEDPKARGSSKTAALSGTGSKVKFDIPDSTIKRIDSVTVNGALKANYTDYYVDYNDKSDLSNPVVYFLTPPSDGALVEIKYTYGQTWIYPDVPRVDLSLDSFPRANVNFVSIRTEEAGLGAGSNLTDVLGSVNVWSVSEIELMGVVDEVRRVIMQSKKDFHYFKLMVPQGTSPVLVAPNRNGKVLMQAQDFLIRLRLEVV